MIMGGVVKMLQRKRIMEEVRMRKEKFRDRFFIYMDVEDFENNNKEEDSKLSFKIFSIQRGVSQRLVNNSNIGFKGDIEREGRRNV